MNGIDEENGNRPMNMPQNKMNIPYKYGHPNYGNPWGHGQYWKGGYGPHWQGGYMPYWQVPYGISPWALLFALNAFGPRYMMDGIYDPYDIDMYK